MGDRADSSSRRELLIASVAAFIMAGSQSSSAAPPAPATALLLDPVYTLHDTGPGHPERPARYVALTEAFTRAGVTKSLHHISPRFATEDEVAACHSLAYIQKVKREIDSGARQLSTGDTAVSAKSFDIAIQAAGGILNAVDAIMEGTVANAFCAVRPPGHHARPDQGMGFCIFNSIAIASRYAQRKHGIERVLIADWDVHHGNGTQDIFYSDGSVFFFSTHQSPWYPGTGKAEETGQGKGTGCTMNCPFPSGSGRAEILGAFQKKLGPAADSFKPDLVMISAGFDSRIDDPLGQFTLTDPDFVDLTKVMLEIAAKHAGGRLISVLEGGYNLGGLASSATAHVKALAHELS